MMVLYGGIAGWGPSGEVRGFGPLPTGGGDVVGDVWMGCHLTAGEGSGNAGWRRAGDE
jgi:hypothetical protein